MIPDLSSLNLQRVSRAVLRRLRRVVDGARHRAQRFAPPWKLRTAEALPSSASTLLMPDYSDLGVGTKPQDDG
jgi:hypothetical protein